MSSHLKNNPVVFMIGTMLNTFAKTGVIVCLFVAFAIPVYPQNVSDVEQQLMDTVERNYEDMMSLLREVVDINSGTRNLEGVRKVGDVFDRAFRSIGFHTEWIAMPEEMNRAGHLVATRGGSGGIKVLLLGHLDTVFEASAPFEPFTVYGDSIATGQGVIDMKGGNVIVFAALQALHENDLLHDAHITVYFTGDEESPGSPRSASRGHLVDVAKEADVALSFEASEGRNSAIIGRRGISIWQLNVQGRQGHSMRIFTEEQGYGAIYEAARIVNEFREELTGEAYLTFNPGQITGGSDIALDEHTGKAEATGKTNVIAQKAHVMGDLRYLSDEQKEDSQERMRAIVSRSLPQTSAEIHFQEGFPAMYPSDGNKRVLDVLNRVNQDLGFGKVVAVDPGSRGAADLNFIAQYVDGVDGIGASGSGFHALDETIDLKEFPDLMKRSTLLLHRLIQTGY